MPNSRGYPDEFEDRADDERGEQYRDEVRDDARAEKGPAPELPVEPVSELVEFLRAAKRGCLIFEAADAPQTVTVARAVGATTERLLCLADDLHTELSEGHAHDPVSAKAQSLLASADLFLIGILIGRELPPR